MTIKNSHYILLISFLLAWSPLLHAQKSKNDKKEQKLIRQEQELRQAEEYFIEGNKDYILGKYDKAFDWFQRANKLSPDKPAFLFKLSECFAQQNDINRAIQYSEKAVELDPKNKYYGLLLGQLYEKNKNYKDAVKIYEKIIKQSAGNDELLLNIANIQQLTNDFEGAIKTYNRLEAIYGINEEIVRQKQMLYLKQNRLDDAIKEWRKLIAAFPEDHNLQLDLANLLYVNNKNVEAKKILEDIVSKNPDAPFASLMLYEIYRKENKFEKADKELEKAFLSPQLNIDAKIGVTVSLLRQLSSDTTLKKQSIKLGDILVKVHPNEAKAYAMNGDILAIQERKQDAFDNYVKSVDLDNSHYKIWQQIVFLASELNKNDSVIKYSERAIEVFPSQPLFFYYGGSAYSSKKNYPKAVYLFESGQKIAGSNMELNVQFLSQLGDTYNSLKLFAKSDSSYEAALKIDSENVHVLNNYSYYLSLRKEKLDKAKKMCEKMLEKSPNEPAYLDTYAWVLYKIKDYENARKYMEKALLKTSDATIVEHYGDVLFQLGN
ncbi:MAG: tetratricopeptide repeat protein, partial [Methylotenera sp.]|nr:tetratricopeptide repeat protein [Flavobacterium sp.]